VLRLSCILRTHWMMSSIMKLRKLALTCESLLLVSESSVWYSKTFREANLNSWHWLFSLGCIMTEGEVCLHLCIYGRTTLYIVSLLLGR
jgi:hypothetical protein